MSKPELRVEWSKRERDFMIHFPCKPDGNMIQGFICHDRNVCGKTLVEELKERGYDLTTLRISVRRQKERP